MASRVLLFVFGMCLLVSSGVLMREGLFHFGVTFPALLGASFLAIAWAWKKIQVWRSRSSTRQRIWFTGWMCVGMWEMSVLGFFVLIENFSQSQSLTAAIPVAIIVLGSGSPRCEVSATLQSRLEVAYTAASKWGQALVVVSGGKDLLGRPCTEAETMRNALVRMGLSKTRILMEEASTSTAENFQLSRTVLANAGIANTEAVTFVSSDFHGMRALHIGIKEGFDKLTFLPAPTPWKYRFNAWLREYFASLSSWILRET